MNILKFKNWNRVFEEEEAAPRLPKSEEYWIKKGKEGKSVALYTHDDMDGIFSAIEVKKYLLNAGFKIVKYGVLNYSEGWKYTSLDPKLINVVVDFANMLEAAAIKTIEDGIITKDLLELSEVQNKKCVNTRGFLEEIGKKLFIN
jgi:single-stranded DNA-specific DHH superfamily exonuclease